MEKINTAITKAQEACNNNKAESPEKAQYYNGKKIALYEVKSFIKARISELKKDLQKAKDKGATLKTNEAKAKNATKVASLEFAINQMTALLA